MIPQLILIILSFILIWLAFKLIYLEKNAFRMNPFWIVQISVAFIWLAVGRNMWLLIPYLISFLIILIVFKIINREQNPFKRIRFWVIQFIAAAVITIVGVFIIFRTLGEKRSPDENLANDIQLETITSITIIQRKDTVHLDSIYPFVYKLYYVEHVSGPVKYPNMGKIIFIRKDGSRESISTNGYGFGPYKGQWYQSKNNVLEEYFK